MPSEFIWIAGVVRSRHAMFYMIGLSLLSSGVLDRNLDARENLIVS